MEEEAASTSGSHRLTNDEVARYSRQLVLPEIGVKGQKRLKNTKVLIVGAGGLGCPVAVYLAGAGIGVLGLVDYDEVEVNNLHRQIMHSETKLGMPKVESLKNAILELNSNVVCVPYHLQIDSRNARVIIDEYDIVVDASDNVPTRYLLNDACVLAGKPLVSGSALRFEGQLTVYHHEGGPCYRCLYPEPPPPETVTNCSDGGVLGAVPGVIGTIQASEVVKLAVGLAASYSGRMLLYDGLCGTFRTVRLRSRQTNCRVCGDAPTVTALMDYEVECRMKACDKEKNLVLLSPEERLNCQSYKSMVDGEEPHLLVDVREPVELEICGLPNAYNLPMSKLESEECLRNLREKLEQLTQSTRITVPVVVLCRRGNDSQLAVRSLRRKLRDLPVSVRDIAGGLHAWSAEIDPRLPIY